MAIRSRFKAGQLARAATLAAWALSRHPDDAPTKALVSKTLSGATAKLHQLDVQCSAPCVLAVDERGVPGPARTEVRLFVVPGRRRVSASFAGGRSAPVHSVMAVAAGRSAVALAPPPAIEPKPVSVPEKKLAATVATSPTPDASSAAAVVTVAPSTSVISGAASDSPTQEVPSRASTSDQASEPGAWYASPVLLGLLVVSTLGLSAGTIYSGVDTLENPGPDAVREACVGQGTSCALYQEALAKQTRTNILIGASVGAGVLSLTTAVFLTEWSDDAVIVGVHPMTGGAGLSLRGRL